MKTGMKTEYSVLQALRAEHDSEVAQISQAAQELGTFKQLEASRGKPLNSWRVPEPLPVTRSKKESVQTLQQLLDQTEAILPLRELAALDGGGGVSHSAERG